MKNDEEIELLATAATRPWLNCDLSATDRARLLLEAMTLDEKIGLLHGQFGAVAPLPPGEKRKSTGRIPGIERLGIPALYETDSTLGVANITILRPDDYATALPCGPAIAATFEPSLAFEGGRVAGSEARGKGYHIMLGGGANLIRDPWCGRSFEYFSEDVLLTGEMAAAAVRGVQSNRIVCTTKHFALNSQETGRHVVDARIGDAELRESDLLAFQLVIEKGDPGSVMCAYNKVNGAYTSESSYLLNDVLKGEWGYDGWVMSDWGAVHSVEAANAGLDQQSGAELDREIYFGEPLRAAVEGGKVSPDRLDDMVLRILTRLFRHGVLDDPPEPAEHTIDYDSHGDVAQRIAEAGIVLLKNESHVLPIATSVKKLLVCGGHADVGVPSGAGSSQVRSVGGNALELEPGPEYKGMFAAFLKRTFHASSPLEEIRALAPDCEVEYLDGSDINAAAAAAALADVAIVFADEWRTENWDQESLNLKPEHEALITAVCAAARRSVVVLETGGPVLMPWNDLPDAILAAWYPGQRGGRAIARILFGKVNPSGRLPLTFPASAEQAPRPTPPGLDKVKQAEYELENAPPDRPFVMDISGGVEPFAVEYGEGADVGYRWYGRTGAVPLFPFGFGLSYTTFAYSDLTVSGDGDRTEVTFVVSNTGELAGAEVAQVYVTPPDGVSRLAAFKRVILEPGEQARVSLALDPRLYSRYSTAKRRWITPDQFEVGAGSSVRDIKLAQAFTC